MRIAFAVAMVLAAAALGQAQPGSQTAARAVAVVQPTQGSTANGVVRFEQTGEDSVKVTADLKGLPPSKTLGFHIHEFGDLSSPDGTSAGGHFNPQGHSHAGPDAPQHHAGDLGNIESDAQGNAHKEVTVQGISVSGPAEPDHRPLRDRARQRGRPQVPAHRQRRCKNRRRSNRNSLHPAGEVRGTRRAAAGG